MHPLLPPSQVVKAAAITTTASAVHGAADGTLSLGPTAYSAVAVVLALIGVILARMVSVNDENKRLGVTQPWRDTGPLTWIAVLMVCPFIWHYQVAVPWASLIGLGTGYSVRIILRILGVGMINTARAMARQTGEALQEVSAPSLPPAPEEAKRITSAIRHLDHLDDSRPSGE